MTKKNAGISITARISAFFMPITIRANSEMLHTKGFRRFFFFPLFPSNGWNGILMINPRNRTLKTKYSLGFRSPLIAIHQNPY
jgi:hypothetical protein